MLMFYQCGGCESLLTQLDPATTIIGKIFKDNTITLMVNFKKHRMTFGASTGTVQSPEDACELSLVIMIFHPILYFNARYTTCKTDLPLSLSWMCSLACQHYIFILLVELSTRTAANVKDKQKTNPLCVIV